MSLLKPIFLLVLLLLFAVCAHSPTQTTAPMAARPQEEDSVIQVANEDVVAGKLGLKVFAHRIEHVRCWTYATAGLWALGQRELLLSVKQEPAEADGAFPRRLLGFFRIVYERAAQKQLMDEGGVWMLSDKDPPRCCRPAHSAR